MISGFHAMLPNSCRCLMPRWARITEKAPAFDSSDTETSSRLAQSYEQERMFVGSPEEKATLAQKAVSVRERGLEKADPSTGSMS
jgi:hypothetical protein